MDKKFMDYASEDFDVSVFINELGDIDSMSSFDILEKVHNLNANDRRYVLDNKEIRNKLRHGLLFESSDNQWYYYRKILEKITPSEFLSLYDSSYLTEYFIHTEHNEEKYKFYAALCENDINDVVSYILKNKDLYEDFFKNSDAFYSSFEGLNYDLFREVILKKQEEGLNLSSYFLNSIKIEYQYDIINDPLINDDTLVFLLLSFSNAVKSYFFENDYRALYLYTRFDINNLASKGVKFNDNILKKKDFFDSLKSDSFIEFRTNINNVEKYNNPIIIEDNLEKYYDEIIGFYQSESGLFGEYEDVLNNPGSKYNNSYIFDFDVAYKVNHYLKQDEDGNFYYENIDELLAFLRSETSRKLSEVIIDALFRDNIYNVWINIKEMLRYHNLLEDGNKVIDRQRCDFYEMILNFDKIDNSDKIGLYNKLKGKNFSLVFYNDLRKIKDVAYNRINDNLINLGLHPEYIDKVNTDKYGVQVYDLRDNEYTMLVRTQGDFREVDHYKRGCYSIISNENTQVFGEYDYSSFLYGYNSFENDRVLHMFESDSYSSNFRDEPSRYVNRIMTSDQLVKSSVGYSEVQLVNIKSDKKKYRWYAKKPDFIVAFNLVGDKHVKESKRLGIPIVVISRKKLTKDDVIDVGLDIDVDAYVKNIVGEREHRIRR